MRVPLTKYGTVKWASLVLFTFGLRKCRDDIFLLFVNCEETRMRMLAILVEFTDSLGAGSRGEPLNIVEGLV